MSSHVVDWLLVAMKISCQVAPMNRLFVISTAALELKRSKRMPESISTVIRDVKVSIEVNLEKWG